MPTSKCLTEGPESPSANEAVIPGEVEPQWPPSLKSGKADSPLLHDTLGMLAPRPGEPGSEDNPGTIVPGPTQKWLAAAFHGGLIPIERLRLKNEQCSKRSICEEGTCCLDYGRKRKRCKPLSKRGEHCAEWALTTIYFGACPCGPNEGTCQFGICK
uniref:Ixodegrin B n=1 Tax=Rhipicephalus microplus TaxID=6941 RepID=A0A6G5A2E4_RHIMP